MIYLITLGCPKNSVDSRHLQAKLETEGIVFTDNVDNAQVVLINTCGFIKAAKEESIEEILQTVKHDDKKVIVFGCLAHRYREELKKEIPEIEAVFGVGEDDKIIQHIKSNHKNILTPHKSQAKKNLQNTSYAYLKIADGCSRRCSYCAIPSIRGGFKSIAVDDILADAEKILNTGIKELILVAQDITSFGREFKDYGGLVRLLKDISAIDKDFFIRLLYLYPTAISEELINEIASNDKVLKYLDIPLQHSEDRLLSLMSRAGNRRDYLRLIRKIRKAMPGVALRTTFIVGFPSETEEDFQNLLDFIQDVRFDRLGAFAYSDEEGTPAYRLRPKIPEKLKRQRLQTLMIKQAEISYEKNQGLIGKTFSAIIDELADDYCIARLYSHAPEIDGVVLIHTDSINKTPSIGDVIDVIITEAMDYDLKAKVIQMQK